MKRLHCADCNVFVTQGDHQDCLLEYVDVPVGMHLHDYTDDRGYVTKPACNICGIVREEAPDESHRYTQKATSCKDTEAEREDRRTAK